MATRGAHQAGAGEGPGGPSGAAPVAPFQRWALASGKGGVGRSFLAAGLGCALAMELCPALVADLDFSGSNLHTYLGLAGGLPGVETYLRPGGPSLSSLLRPLEVPGLSFLPGTQGSGWIPAGRARDRLSRQLSQLPFPVALMDLDSGVSRHVLDFFVAAHRPILVVLPEPAAVEGAHRFIRLAFIRRLTQLAVLQGFPPSRFRQEILTQEPGRPSELYQRLERQSKGLGRTLEEAMASFSLYLVVNQVRHASDVEVGRSLKSAVQSYFGLRARFVGAVPFDHEAWLSARRRRLRVREPTGGVLLAELEQVARNLLEDVEYEPIVGAWQG